MNKVKRIGLVLLALGLASAAMAADADPNQTVIGAGATAQTGWTTFATISAAAFVFGMVIAYSKKGKR
jgi:hypothetical protein